MVICKDVKFLEGFETVITSPDDMLAGEIKFDGKVIFEGEGGVFFVTKFGDVWASGKRGTANSIRDKLNEQLKANGGRAFLTLTKGTDSKLVSSASGVNSTLAILNTMSDKKLITPSNFRNAARQDRGFHLDFPTIRQAYYLYNSADTPATSSSAVEKILFIQHDTNNKVSITENTIGFKLNFKTNHSIEMAVYEEAGANDQVLQATAVNGNTIFVNVQTKTKRRRGAWR